MSEAVLYRKYRPKSFKEVIGQDQVVSVLQSAVKSGTVAHAYLFAGSRGTGKTSVARLLAEAIDTKPSDLYEIDAASNRGIDDIRELRASVSTLPFESPQKVYIIDEVHMLTKEAFNALLKTLEEPPKHAVFILATTEIDRLPDTVVSRCQTFTFHKPTQNVLKDMVIKVAKAEGFSLEHAAGDLIALLGEGSFRDTQGILQKVIAGSKDTKISIKEVEQVTGAPKGSLVNDFIQAIVDKDSAKGLTAISVAVGDNIDMGVYLRLILYKVRAILILTHAPKMAVSIGEALSTEDFDFVKKLAGGKGGPLITPVTLLELLSVYEMSGISALPQLPLELALIKLTGK